MRGVRFTVGCSACMQACSGVHASVQSGVPPALAVFMRTARSLCHVRRTDYKVADGETTAMHLIIKKQDTKQSDAPSGADDKTPKCNCVIC